MSKIIIAKKSKYMFSVLIHEHTYQKTTKQCKWRNCSYIQQHGLILETMLNGKSCRKKCILCNSPLCVFQQLAESESVSRSVGFDSLDLMDCSPPGSSVRGILQARILKWVAIQGIFPTQWSNLGLPNCRQILYHLGQQGSPIGR